MGRSGGRVYCLIVGFVEQRCVGRMTFPLKTLGLMMTKVRELFQPTAVPMKSVALMLSAMSV